MLNRLLRDRAVMREKAEALLGLLNQPCSPPARELAEARWQFASCLMQHLAFVDRHFYAKLLNDERAFVQETARRFQADLATLFCDYSENARYWIPQRIEADWNGFRSTVRARISRLCALIEKEEAELLPFVCKSMFEDSPIGTPTHNWTRDAFPIKDAITKGTGYAA